MSQIYNKLWIFGDSHTTPDLDHVPSDQSFWGLAAKHLGVATIDNCSRPKLSFDSVLHILVGEQHQYCWDKDFFIIGLPPLERITIFDNYKDTEFLKKSFDTNDWKTQTSTVVSHHGLVNLQYSDLEKVFVTMHDRSWLETQVLRQLFLLTQWLDVRKASYLIVNLSKNLDSNNQWGPAQTILDYCNNHPRCEVFKNSLYACNLNLHKPVDFHQYGWYGHHGSDGHRHFFETTVKNKLC